MACRKALRADAGNKREETGREGGAGVARTSQENDKPSLTVVRRDAKDPTTVAEQKVVLGHP